MEPDAAAGSPAPPYPLGEGIPIPELTQHHVTNDKDPFAFLEVFDTVFLIDDSESMQQHWHEVIALICAVVPICCERDHNGIDLYFVNHRPRSYSFFSSVEKSGYRGIGLAVGSPLQSDNVAGIFHKVKPQGRARLGARLGEILAKYVSDYSFLTRLHGKRHCKRPMNLIVVTDGHIEDSMYGHLAAAARELDRVRAPSYQAGVQLFQIGHDPRISAGLKVDDEMYKQEGTRDMVDTTTWNGRPGVLSAEGVLKVVLGAVSRSLDRSTVTPTGLVAAEVPQQDD
ncbi:von willebrand factor [Apiospora rasikravindrae]|uniref:von willebrand factor n=1 Tax=Apiospora rasikravindrae TaxID=990691 RepID=A0ABR1TCV5_9PEZI